MGNRSKNYEVSYLSGSVILIPADPYRRELILQNASTSTIYYSFNEPALSGVGVFLPENMIGVFSPPRSYAAIYATCNAPLTGLIAAEITPGG